MLETAVVILNFNGREYLEKFLPGVIKNSTEAKVIVVDNASTDDSIGFLNKNFPDLEILALSTNKGFTGGYNEALSKIEAEIFVLLNTDVEVTHGWITPIVTLMEEDKSIAACQPKILSYNEKDKFEYAGAAGGFIDYLGFPFCRGRLFQSLENDSGQYNDVRQVFWASGACLFLRKKAFEDIGGFDQDYFAHMEEIDLCWRMQNAGLKIFYNGNSTIYHVGGGTLSRSNPKKTYLNFRNGLSMFLKNEKPLRLWWKLPTRGFLDMVAMVKFTLFDSWKDGLAVLKAHWYFWLRLGTGIKKRRNAKKHWSVRSPKLIVYRGFVVLDYYLMGKKKFEQLKFKKYQ